MNADDDSIPVDAQRIRITDAWRNAPALATLLLTCVAVALPVLAVAARPSSGALPAVAAGVALFVVGLAAAGSQFAEQAGGRPVSSVARAFAAAPLVVARTLLFAGVLSLAAVAFALVAVAVLFACRLPFFGTLIYVVALPVLTFAGAALLPCLAGAALLALPALWEGHSLRTVLSQLLAIAAQRRLQALADLVPSLVAAALVAAIVSFFVLAAFGTVATLSIPVSGAIDLRAAFAAWTGDARAFDAAPFVAATPVAVALVAATTVALLVALFQFGLAIGYRRATAGIDIAAARAALARAIVEVQVKKGQAAEDLRSFVQRMRDAHPTRSRPRPASAQLVPAVDAGTIAREPQPAGAEPLPGAGCAHCRSPAAPDDAFCGQCGRPLHAEALDATAPAIVS